MKTTVLRLIHSSSVQSANLNSVESNVKAKFKPLLINSCFSAVLPNLQVQLRIYKCKYQN